MCCFEKLKWDSFVLGLIKKRLTKLTPTLTIHLSTENNFYDIAKHPVITKITQSR